MTNAGSEMQDDNYRYPIPVPVMLKRKVEDVIMVWEATKIAKEPGRPVGLARLSKMHHPDHNPGCTQAPSRFLAIRQGFCLWNCVNERMTDPLNFFKFTVSQLVLICRYPWLRIWSIFGRIWILKIWILNAGYRSYLLSSRIDSSMYIIFISIRYLQIGIFM